MSVGAKTEHQQAPALVHCKPVQSGLVRSKPDMSSVTSDSRHGWHAGCRGQCSHIDAALFEPLDVRADASHRGGCSAESP